MNERDFVGTWRLISWESQSADGTVTYPYGEDARGFIVYSPDGYVSVVIFKAVREDFGTSDPLVGTEEQLAAAARSYISYVGRYEVHGDQVHHVVAASLFPDWVGTTQKRFYEFEGDRLTLSTGPISLGGEEARAVLTWELATKPA